MTLLGIAWRNIRQRLLTSGLTALSLALGVALVVATLVTGGIVKQAFESGSGLGYNMIVGAKGSPLQLVLNSVYFISRPIENISWAFYQEFLPAAERPDGTDGTFAASTATAVPICMGDYYRSHRVIGTNTAFFDRLEPVAGTGASRGEVAARLGLRPGTVWTLCVAPLDPCAHLDRLLWAVDQLGVVHRGLEHVLVGAGPLVGRVHRRARLQRLAERLFVHASVDCLPDLLPRVRLVWQAGEVAGGGCLLDGMAHGVAAVAVDGSAARRLIVDGVTGRLVAADPISELPRRALPIIEDDALAARYGSAARDRAARDFPLPAFAAGIVAAVARAG